MPDFDAIIAAALEEINKPVDLDSPLRRTSMCTPAYGAFVVFTLDPVATIETLEDPVALEEARALLVRKYVGYVTQVMLMTMPTRRYHLCSCYILSQGLPIPHKEFCIDERMCVAVHPATHPDGRPAVTPSPPLPWDNLYLHSLDSFTFRIPTAKGIVDHSSSPMITRRQYIKVMTYTDDDTERWQDSIIARPSRNPPAAPGPSVEEFPQPPANAAPLLSKSDVSSGASSTSAGDYIDSITSDGNSRASAGGSIVGDLYSDFLASVVNSIGSDGDSIASGGASNPSTADSTGNEDDGELHAAEGDSASQMDSTNIPVAENVLLDSLHVGIARMLLEDEDPHSRSIPVADFDLDLGTVKEFANASCLRHELTLITGIIERSQQRSRAALENLNQESAEAEKSSLGGMEPKLPAHANSSPRKFKFARSVFFEAPDRPYTGLHTDRTTAGARCNFYVPCAQNVYPAVSLIVVVDCVVYRKLYYYN